MTIPPPALDAALRDLAGLVAIPSVSAQGRQLDSCAARVAGLLEEAGFVTGTHPGAVAPFVVGETGAGDFTLVIYNHYDVQPEEPLGLWTSDPFTLTERDGRLFGRGAADDKGEFVSRLAGWRAFRDTLGDRPLSFRLIWIVEGEEEIGSPSLAAFLQDRFPDLRADLCWWEFGEVDASGRPVVLLGFKGNLAVELACRTGAADLHSSLGAVVDNAAWRIAAALASLRDAAGRVRIPGFYDGIAPPEAATRALVDPAPFSLESLRAATGAPRLLDGMDEGSFFAALNFAPCLNVNGITAGYAGEGSKTVLPARASAKLDIRLVPGQDPDRIAALLRRHLDDAGFADIDAIPLDAAVLPVRSDPDHWAIALGCDLLGRHFGRPAILQPSSPATGLAQPFVDRMGARLFGAGLTHHGARLHAPDENIVRRHFDAMAAFSADYFAALDARCRPPTPTPEPGP